MASILARGWLSVPPGCCQSLGVLKNGLSRVMSSEFPITVGIQGDIGWSADRAPQVSIDGLEGASLNDLPCPF